ncbi:MAG TPA: hypothetical protein VK811_05680 [Candidatus Acidoferrum sp.]|jgi:hypothetical protein|nr:hypothetical protein [Candidatus Acidoferrum sp.]
MKLSSAIKALTLMAALFISACTTAQTAKPAANSVTVQIFVDIPGHIGGDWVSLQNPIQVTPGQNFRIHSIDSPVFVGLGIPGGANIRYPAQSLNITLKVSGQSTESFTLSQGQKLVQYKAMVY